MAVRPLKPLADFLADFLGDPPGREGGRSGHRWWRCPFHGDRNPSFAVKPGDLTYS